MGFARSTALHTMLAIQVLSVHSCTFKRKWPILEFGDAITEYRGLTREECFSACWAEVECALAFVYIDGTRRCVLYKNGTSSYDLSIYSDADYYVLHRNLHSTECPKVRLPPWNTKEDLDD
ncbi:unnamed protein product [Nippostrongylus brasiliensis]|uniref:Apple domain-containing protein n=1 Tax=Nippostrongylus brasiliensis TaxID=27835 RepID=A0A0N4YDL1_NIPBR|nr:unnamed protein product [Nippostrongylus brasiliensis]